MFFPATWRGRQRSARKQLSASKPVSGKSLFVVLQKAIISNSNDIIRPRSTVCIVSSIFNFSDRSDMRTRTRLANSSNELHLAGRCSFPKYLLQILLWKIQFEYQTIFRNPCRANSMTYIDPIFFIFSCKKIILLQHISVFRCTLLGLKIFWYNKIAVSPVANVQNTAVSLIIGNA